MARRNLVDEAHKALGEIAAVRKDFHKGALDTETAKQSIGFFNATSRSLNAAIQAEKWYKKKQTHGK